METPAMPPPMMAISHSWGRSAVVRVLSRGSGSVRQKESVWLGTGKGGLSLRDSLIDEGIWENRSGRGFGREAIFR